jgi:membrane protein
MIQFWQRVEWLNSRSKSWLGAVANALRGVLAPDASTAAAAIAYFTLFSLFPLTLFTIAIASLWLDPMLIEGEVVKRLEFVAPAMGRLLGANIERIVLERRSATGVAAVALLWSASTIFHVITRALDKIWEVNKRRPVWRHRGLAIITALSLSLVLLVVSLVGSIVATVVSALAPDELRSLYPILSHFSAPLLSIILFGLLYYFLPHTRITIGDVVPGAIAAGLLWELAKRGFLYFVANYLTLSNLVYGSVATLVAFLTWAYVSSIIFLFGAHLNVQLCRLKSRREEEASRR